MNNSRKRALAENLYIYEGLQAKEIANILEVTPKTLSAWKKSQNGEPDWDTRKKEAHSAPHRIKELLYKELYDLLEGKGKSVDSDAIVKLSAAIERIDKNIKLPTVVTVFKSFNNWLVEQDTPAAIELSKWQLKYLRYISELE